MGLSVDSPCLLGPRRWSLADRYWAAWDDIPQNGNCDKIVFISILIIISRGGSGKVHKQRLQHHVPSHINMHSYISSCSRSPQVRLAAAYVGMHGYVGWLSSWIITAHNEDYD